jgi:hypothetical protein
VNVSRSAFRRLLVALALLQALLPVLSYANMARQGLLTQEVCTAQGIKRFAQSAQGDWVEVESGASHSPQCNLCGACAQAPLAFTVPQWHGVTALVQWIETGVDVDVESRNWPYPPATGPPPSTER